MTADSLRIGLSYCICGCCAIRGWLGVVRIDGRRQVAMTTHCISTFFDVYLKGEPASELKDTSEYPEIEYLHPR
jgi:hypothetical protein